MLGLEFGQEAMQTWKHTNRIPNILGGTDPIPLKFAFYEDCCHFNAYEQAHAIQIPTIIVLFYRIRTAQQIDGYLNFFCLMASVPFGSIGKAWVSLVDASTFASI